jgi:hypothetical protein
MLARLTELRSYRVQATDGDLGSTEPVTPELEPSLRGYRDRYSR